MTGQTGLPLEGLVVVDMSQFLSGPYCSLRLSDLGARVISNDRYRDWLGDFPELAAPGQILRGGYRKGALWLETGAPDTPG